MQKDALNIKSSLTLLVAMLCLLFLIFQFLGRAKQQKISFSCECEHIEFKDAVKFSFNSTPNIEIYDFLGVIRNVDYLMPNTPISGKRFEIKKDTQNGSANVYYNLRFFDSVSKLNNDNNYSRASLHGKLIALDIEDEDRPTLNIRSLSSQLVLEFESKSVTIANPARVLNLNKDVQLSNKNTFLKGDLESETSTSVILVEVAEEKDMTFVETKKKLNNEIFLTRCSNLKGAFPRNYTDAAAFENPERIHLVGDSLEISMISIGQKKNELLNRVIAISLSVNANSLRINSSEALPTEIDILLSEPKKKNFYWIVGAGLIAFFAFLGKQVLESITSYVLKLPLKVIVWSSIILVTICIVYTFC